MSSEASNMLNENNNDIVLFEEIVCDKGLKLGLATLNTPKTLNGLSLAMTRLLATQFEAWVQDQTLAVIILKGAGDKAFCAGGDLHTLYHEMTEHKEKSTSIEGYPNTFFSEEYALDYRIHTFPKPILVWGDGIVMGGGMGLMAGASHRVVTETSRLAMPEITIGLFPDVGGTWLLNRLPGKTGLFMGLTGAQIGASDALFAGMADYHLPRQHWDALISTLKGLDWIGYAAGEGSLSPELQSSRLGNDALLHNSLSVLASDPAPAIGPLQQHVSLIQKLCNGSDLNLIVQNILALATSEDPWLARAAKTLAAGSPGSARLTYELLARCKHVSLAQAYRIELIAGIACAAHGDFQEGIRALLIDKDKIPKWNPAELHTATAQWVEKFFVSPFKDGEHPLRELGR
jgi:enoyl-CoA hydratase/carnithine racemase